MYQLKGDWHLPHFSFLVHLPQNFPFPLLLLQENSPQLQPALPSGQNQQGPQCPLGCQSQSTSILHQASDSCTQGCPVLLKPTKNTISSILYMDRVFHPVFISSTSSLLDPLSAPHCSLFPFLSGWMRSCPPLWHTTTQTFLGSGRTETPQDMQELRSDCHSHSPQSRGDAVPKLAGDSVTWREQHSTRDTKNATGCHVTISL